MRTIKFRAWDKRLKAMIKVTHDYQLHVRDIYWEIIDLKIGCKVLDNWRDNENGNVLMQYTGIKDKNGKEIYEGDVVRFKYWDNDIPQDATNWGVVAYRNEMACFYLTQNVCIMLAKQREMEIIGNIYEHSHLLSGGQQ